MIQKTERITAWALFDRDPVPRWSFGRVTLLGDAAHPLLPFGSQGASQAVLDCQALEAVFRNLLPTAENGHPGKRALPLDVVGALREYDKKRVGPASAVVVANRDMGPTRVLRVVAEATEGLSIEAKRKWIESEQVKIQGITRNYHRMTLSTIAKGSQPVCVASAQFFSGKEERPNKMFPCVSFLFDFLQKIMKGV